MRPEMVVSAERHADHAATAFRKCATQSGVKQNLDGIFSESEFKTAETGVESDLESR